MKKFESINRGYNSSFQAGKLSLGVVVPIENYPTSPVPQMTRHIERVKLIEKLGFKALWIRDIPFHVPSFGDAGQTYDPFTYLGFLAGQTNEIALGVASIALPLHHPVHVAKSAATIDQLSKGRLILGVASGDRPSEYPGMGIEFEKRAELFRESFQYIRAAQESFPTFNSKHYGKLKGQVDILPKAYGYKLPLLLTGFSRQSIEWNAEYADGWMSYPKNLGQQSFTLNRWRELIPQDHSKPFMQPLYLELMPEDDFKPETIPLGIRVGAKYLRDFLHLLEEIGVNHVALNLRFNSQNIEESLEALGEKVLPHFHKNQQEESIK